MTSCLVDGANLKMRIDGSSTGARQDDFALLNQLPDRNAKSNIALLTRVCRQAIELEPCHVASCRGLDKKTSSGRILVHRESVKTTNKP